MEKKRIREWLKGHPGEYDFMKFPHHGVYNSALKDLIEETKPEMVAICDSMKNPADEKTLELLRGYSTVLRTMNGDITVTCDGDRLEYGQR